MASAEPTPMEQNYVLHLFVPKAISIDAAALVHVSFVTTLARANSDGAGCGPSFCLEGVK